MEVITLDYELIVTIVNIHIARISRIYNSQGCPADKGNILVPKNLNLEIRIRI